MIVCIREEGANVLPFANFLNAIVLLVHKKYGKTAVGYGFGAKLHFVLEKKIVANLSLSASATFDRQVPNSIVSITECCRLLFCIIIIAL